MISVLQKTHTLWLMVILKADVNFSTHINHWRAAQVDHDHGPWIIQIQSHEKQSNYDYG